MVLALAGPKRRLRLTAKLRPQKFRVSWTLDGFLLVAADGCRIKATDIVGFGVAGVVEPMTDM